MYSQSENQERKSCSLVNPGKEKLDVVAYISSELGRILFWVDLSSCYLSRSVEFIRDNAVPLFFSEVSVPLSWDFLFSLQRAHCSPLHATEGRGKSDFTHQRCLKARCSKFLVATCLQTCSLSLQTGSFPDDAPAYRTSSAVAEPHRQGGNTLGFFKPDISLSLCLSLWSQALGNAFPLDGFPTPLRKWQGYLLIW